MKHQYNYMKTLLISLIVSLGIASIAEAQDSYSVEALQQLYIGMLNQNEIDGWVDEDGDIQFDYADKSYFIAIYEDDPEFFQLSMFNIWPIEGPIEATQVLLAVDTVNRNHKVVKAYTINNDVWLNVEMFLSSPFEATTVFARSLENVRRSC